MNARLALTCVAVSLAVATLVLSGCQAQQEKAASEAPKAAPAPEAAAPKAPPPATPAPAAKPAPKAAPAPPAAPPPAGEPDALREFKRMDTNGDENLSPDEWKVIMQPDQFSKFDRNSDGKVDYDEFMKGP